jgi:hypothetical protein
MTPILHTLMTGGSGTGMSYWLKWLDCPKKAWLDEQADSPEARAAYCMTYSATLVGTIGHALMEMFWKSKVGVSDWAAIRYSEGAIDADARSEAEKCVACLLGWIRDEESAVPLGTAKVVAVEETCAIADAKALLGCKEFSMRADLVLELTKTHTDALKKCVQNESPGIDGAIEILKPGRWMFDYKFYGQRTGNLLDRSMGSTQFAAYQAVWNHLHPDRAVLGCIQVTVFNLKSPVVRFTVVPPPSKDMLATVINLLAQADDIARNVGPIPKPLDHNCFPYGKVCPHLASGACRRY